MIVSSGRSKHLIWLQSGKVDLSIIPETFIRNVFINKERVVAVSFDLEKIDETFNEGSGYLSLREATPALPQ